MADFRNPFCLFNKNLKKLNLIMHDYATESSNASQWNSVERTSPDPAFHNTLLISKLQSTLRNKY